MGNWECVLKLDKNRTLVSGSEAALCAAIRRGADLHIGTEFRNNEHIDVNSSCAELIREFADFRITYLLDDRWTAAVINLRMPVSIPDDFGPRESMSFFMYNQNAQQALARLHLDGKPTKGQLGTSPVRPHSDMPKYNELDNWDEYTNAPSSNFIYEFDFYRYCVRDQWQEVFSQSKDGEPLSGSIKDLVEAFSSGCEVKIAIHGLCADLADEPAGAIDHEVFVHLGACYYYTERELFIGASQPVVRIRPAIPLVYQSGGWDFGWLVVRTDGYAAQWLCDPYTLKFKKSTERYAIRWFVC